MLQEILKKLGFNTIEDFVNNEKREKAMWNGLEGECPNPFSLLTRDERHFFQNYVNSNNLI